MRSQGRACSDDAALHPRRCRAVQVARLARKLPQGDLAVQAVQLGGSGGGAGVAIDEEGEEDLT